MTEKQRHLLKLFWEIDEICRKHDIEYVAAGGTLIGVLRNHGFIPWDDDMDIMLTRDNWDKFVKACETDLPPGRALQSVDLDRRFTNSIVRYADATTAAIHKHQIVGDDVAGEIVDMLVLDPIPDDDRLYEEYRADLMVYSELVNPTSTFVRRFDISPWRYVKYKLLTKLIGTEKVLARLEQRMYSYREEECSRYVMRWGGCPFLFDKEMLFPAKDMMFEGRPVMVPNHTSDYLVWHYGDEWSYIPPHEKRESHEAVSNLHLNYEVLRQDYMPKLDKKKVLSKATVRKVWDMFLVKDYRKNQEDANRMHAQIVKLSLENTLSQERVDLDSLMERREFSALEDIFEDYYRVQLSARMIGREDINNIYTFDHPLLIELDDHVFYAALYTLFSREKVAKAKRLLDLREKRGPLTPELEQLKGWIVQFRKAADCYEMGQAAEARELAECVLGQQPDHVGLSKFKVRLVMEEAQRTGQWEEACGYIEHCRELWPQDGYFIKYQGDLAWKDKKYERALQLYGEAVEKTQNGMAHLEIQDLLKPLIPEEKERLMSRLEQGLYQETLETARLWAELLPEESVFVEFILRSRMEMTDRTDELEQLSTELVEQAVLEPDNPAWWEMLERAGEKLGYPKGLAKVYAGILTARTGQEAKGLWQELDEAAAGQIEQGSAPEIEQLRGAILQLEGRTDEAFQAFSDCVRMAGRSYAQKAAAGEILKDLYQGELFFRKSSKASNKNMDFLAGLLDKYQSPENIRDLMCQCLRN